MSAMEEFVKVGLVSDFPEGELRACKDGAGKSVVVINRGGRLYAFANYCPHAGLDLTSGFLSARGLVCLYHGSVFDLESGESLAGPAGPLTLYDVRVEGEGVFLSRRGRSSV